MLPFVVNKDYHKTRMLNAATLRNVPKLTSEIVSHRVGLAYFPLLWPLCGYQDDQSRFSRQIDICSKSYIFYSATASSFSFELFVY